MDEPGDTYFRTGRHYHRLRKLNCCVRDGNRCDLSDMVAGKDLTAGIAPPPGRLFGSGLTYLKACFFAKLSSDRFKIPRECEISTANLSPVSTGLLNGLPHLHVQPINLIVFQGAFVLETYEPLSRGGLHA